MARAPLLQLSDISLTFGSLTFGGAPLFAGLSAIVHPGDRVALVGRNGSGKSTLLKVMAGLTEADQGTRVVPAGTSMGYMDQDPDMAGYETLGAFAASGLSPGEEYRVEIAGEGLKFDPARPVATASGGERRRAALAKLWAEEPDLMLLDEPTNHLDIEAIEWLETELSSARAAYIVISHDRAFLTALTRATFWIDRGKVRRQERGFAEFEAWRDKTWAEEDDARHKLDRKIKAEARWAVEGISARRKRNMGRVRALQDLRDERASQIRREGAAALEFDAGKKSGKKVIEARGITKAFDERTVVREFSITVQRGDRVAFVGPNGAGKTTLLNMLTGKLAPDAGAVTLGTNLELAVFDQGRAQIDPSLSLWDALLSEAGLRVSGRADQLMVRGTPRHVVGYLKDFLFDETQARAPVRALSGGERARLLLAKLMAKPSNLLILDEPTNDFDVETLDLLQDILGEYEGTVLLVSHDRDFLDRVATTTVAFEGRGRLAVYAGGWSDYQSQRSASDTPKEPPEKPQAAPKPQARQAPKPTPNALSFTERHRLQALPAEIDRLTAEVAKLADYLSQPDL